MISTRDVHELQGSRLVDALAFCGAAARIDPDKIGWLPHQAYREAFLQQRLVIVENNDDKVGFALWQSSRGQIKLYQVWVRPDARLILHGKALVHHVERLAIEHSAYRLRAWVAQDLAANTFWRSIGFDNISWRYSTRKHSDRKHLLWVRRVPPTLSAELFESSAPHEAQLILPTSLA